MHSHSLSTLLCNPGELTVVADNQDFIELVKGFGLCAQAIDKNKTLPANCLAFSFSEAGARTLFKKAALTKNKKAIFCPLHVFDTSLECAVYSLRLLLKSNFAHCLQQQSLWLRRLEQQTRLHISAEHSNVQVQMSTRHSPYVTTPVDTEGNFILSAAELFEVHYAHLRPHEPCPFQLDGTLRVAGLLTSLSPTAQALASGLKAQLKSLQQRVAVNDAQLLLRQNRVISFQVAGSEYVELLEAAAGDRGLALSEFSIGVNADIGAETNFRINSPLNEGVDGIHIALGDGSSGYHIDFLCPEASVTHDA